MKVVDTSALVAAVLVEPGYEIARTAVDTGLMSMINVSESIAVLIRKGYTREQAIGAVEKSGLTWHSPLYGEALYAADLVLQPQLSLGDSFCIALAKSLNAPVVTADRVWANLNLGVDVELIR